MTAEHEELLEELRQRWLGQQTAYMVCADRGNECPGCCADLGTPSSDELVADTFERCARELRETINKIRA